MAAKYQLITELYRRTGVSVAKSPQAWQSFLSSACRNYKCRFDEQILIYAQRPDAVAVAELGTWNKFFKRWVLWSSIFVTLVPNNFVFHTGLQMVSDNHYKNVVLHGCTKYTQILILLDSIHHHYGSNVNL